MQPLVQAARRLRTSTAMLRHYLRAGRIPGSYKLGRDWYVPDGARLPAKLPPGRKPGK